MRISLCFILTIFILVPCQSQEEECKTVNSVEYGKLFLKKSGGLSSSCISNLIFESKETGKKFCLDKNAKKTDKLTCDGCLCGQENKPRGEIQTQADKNLPIITVGSEVGVVGGSEVGENQYPWYAIVLVRNETLKRGRLTCGGSLITEKVVLSAAHCVHKNASDYLIGLGFHNFSGYSDWSEEQLRKHVIKEVKEIIKHQEFSKGFFNYDFALFVLKDPARLSRIISPVCLPHTNEFSSLEIKENILIGFGTSKIWFLEYKKLLGGKIKNVSLISPEFFSNPIIFANEDFQNRAIQGFFETFTDLFPGVEKCIQNYEFVCNITSQTFDAIMKNIAQKIHNSGIRKEKNDVEAFLEITRDRILPAYVRKINNWTNLVADPDDIKYDSGYLWMINLLDPDSQKIMKKYAGKFLNQWYFMGLTKDVASYAYELSPILKQATGKFLPWSDAVKWNDGDPTLVYQEHESRILCQRFKLKDGYGCHGDSGGPIVVEKKGTFVLVAVASTVPGMPQMYSWPPPCKCSCETVPETHARVSSVLPWIFQNMEQRKLKLPCQRQL